MNFDVNRGSKFTFLTFILYIYIHSSVLKQIVLLHKIYLKAVKIECWIESIVFWWQRDQIALCLIWESELDILIQWCLCYTYIKPFWISLRIDLTYLRCVFRLHISPVICEEVLGLLVQMSVHDVNEGRGPLQVLEIDVPEDPGVDDNMVLDIVIRHCDASIPDLSLCHSHSDIWQIHHLYYCSISKNLNWPVVVHFLLSKLVILVQSLEIHLSG